jgi:hypothetical protein
MSSTTTGKVKRMRYDRYYPDRPSELLDTIPIKLRYKVSENLEYFNATLKGMGSDVQFKNSKEISNTLKVLFSAVYQALVDKDVDYIAPNMMGVYKISASYKTSPKFVIDWKEYNKTGKIRRRRYRLRGNRIHFFKWEKKRYDQFRGNLRYYNFKPFDNIRSRMGKSILIREIIERADDPYRLDFERL